MLLGIVGVDDSVGARVLRDLGVDAAAVRAEAEKIIKPGTRPVPLGQLPFTPRGKRVLELSLDEARGLGHEHLGTEHLLLGLVRENEGIAAQILVRGFGLKVEQIRAKVVEHVPANPDAVKPPWSAPSDAGGPSRLRWLGLLGLLGLLGFVDPRLGYLGFLGFLGFLGTTVRRGASDR
jgi:ATP-dependent Clp protease ATP-binding subunit ClpC